MKKTSFFAIFPKILFLIFFASCSSSKNAAENQSLRIVCWNVQTFFDATKDGTEYSDFLKNKEWGKQNYESRLKKLCSSLKFLDADIFALIEIENEGILYDISNQLASNSWDNRKSWDYACFAKAEDGATGCAIISRYPIKDLKSHFLDARAYSAEQPQTRPILEAKIAAFEKGLVIFINHWKSKSGGSSESDIWRDLQENQLAELINSLPPETPCIACGDFNRDIKEFFIDSDSAQTVLGRTKIALQNFLVPQTFLQEAKMKNPWILTGGSLVFPGSYFYKNEWERIDHFFYRGKISIKDFLPATDGSWCDSEGIPKRYAIYNNSGYSDHLPIKCVVVFE